MKFRIGEGQYQNMAFTNETSVVINSPAHVSGTHEHIIVHLGTALLLKISDSESIILQPEIFMPSQVMLNMPIFVQMMQ